MITPFQQKSYHTLELPKVLELLAAQAVSPQAKERCLALEPEDTLFACQRLQQQTEDAVRLAGLFGSPSFSGVRDVNGALERAGVGGMLNMKELLEIAALLRCARQTKNYLEKDTQVETVLEDYFNRLSGNKYLEEKIEQCIVSEEEMSDSASSELRDIRRGIRTSSSKIREVLNRIITSPSYAKALQDTVITTRGGRYVVPVKAEFKGSIPGLVHDVSSSGATVFVEPMQVVELNNSIREMRAKEKNEMERILSELSQEVADHSHPTIRQDYDPAVHPGFYFCQGQAGIPDESQPAPAGGTGRTQLRRARHPPPPQGTAMTH